ncbi:Hypothetical predicted protein [Paramuricea clavata]|uniref:Uncharacterized protein n=1 Tax=Paramuricea clavata TaxID=317549 RepID=A0A6S7IR63_PARCT|nr:Hypothetical predicted protein [Paramuricea clavata]
MKKITVFIRDGETTIKLHRPLVLTPTSKLYVKTAAVFWTYENIRKGDNNYFSVDKKKVVLKNGYWTFKQLRQRYTTFSELHPGQHPVDIHEGLRYVTIGCNLVNRSQNIDPDGYPSNIVSSLPIDGTKPLFGTTTKYNDIESEVQADAGIYHELHFDNPEWTKYLYWKDGWRNVASDMIFRPNPDFAVNFHTFPIYVSETDSFPVDLEYTIPEYTGTGNFVNLIPFDYHQNSYFRSLAACYVATFKSGISENHLNNTLSNSHLITAIVKFHVHYQTEKFMKNPKLLDHYLSEDDLYVLKKYMPTTETWERRTLSSHANLGTWYYGLPADTRQRIRNQHYVQTPVKKPTSPVKNPVTSPVKNPAKPISPVKNPVKPTSPVKNPVKPTSPVKNSQSPSTLGIVTIVSMGAAYFLWK